MFLVELCFDVTQEHINRGLRCHMCYCPIALAIMDRYGSIFTSALVNNYTIVVYNGLHHWEREIYTLPDEGVKFINDFDKGCSTTPITLKCSRQKSKKEMEFNVIPR